MREKAKTAQQCQFTKDNLALSFFYRKVKSMSMFIDEIVIEVFGGRGGQGMASFRREKFIAFGGPSGGNGGDGGSVIFVGDEGSTTLFDFRYQRHVKAAHGENGKSRSMHGANAEDTFMKVPLGTVAYDEATGEKIGEVLEHEQQLVVAKGGRGGRGNIAFATPRNPAPKFSENGDLGVIRKIKIELKVLADVGVIGYPSVGKSTLITAVSNARPKIAEYPFTTLVPNLGMVRYKDQSFVLADLPGLIENASQGEGLGIQFLKHIERCRIFVHMVDVTVEDPFKSYEIINKELELYNEDLSKRKQIIVLNKIDVATTEQIKKAEDQFQGKDVLKISAHARINIDALLDVIITELEDIPPITFVDKTHKYYTLDAAIEPFVIKRIDGVFDVTGEEVELYFNRTNFATEEGVKRFARQLRTIGVVDELRKMGAKNGDTIRVVAYEFEFID